MTAARVGAAADAVEETMRRLGVWTEPAPPLRPFRAPFGMDAMPFEHWLQLVLVPRLRELARTGAAPPASSNLAGHAVREFDGRDDMAPLVEALRRVDALGAAAGRPAAPAPVPAPGMAFFTRVVATAGIAALVGALVAIAAGRWASSALRAFFLPAVTVSVEGTVAPSDLHRPLRATLVAGVRDDGSLVPGDGSITLHRRGIPVPGDFSHVAEPLAFDAAAPPSAGAIRDWLVRAGVDPAAAGLGPAAAETAGILGVAAAEPTRAGLDDLATRLPPGAPAPQLFDLEARTPGWVDTAAGVAGALLVCVPVVAVLRRRAAGRRMW